MNKFCVHVLELRIDQDSLDWTEFFDTYDAAHEYAEGLKESGENLIGYITMLTGKKATIESAPIFQF